MHNANQMNWWQLTAVQAGGIICLPVIIIGHMLGKNYGWQSAIMAILAGNFILFLISIVTTWASVRWRKSTAEFAIEIFGDCGRSIFATTMVISMVGWFAIQTNVISESVIDLLLPFSPNKVPKGLLQVTLNGIIGIAITLSSIKGLKSLTFIANLSMPVLVLTLGYALFRAVKTEPIESSQEGLDFSGISVVVATAMAAVIDLPTFFREARTTKDGMLAAFLTFAVILPILEFVGIYLFFHFQGENIVETLTGASPSGLLLSWTLLFLVMAGWTTNNANLYSGSVSLEPIFPMIDSKTRLISIGIIATILSCFPILENMEIFLNLLGIALGGMGAVMILQFMINNSDTKVNQEHLYNFLSWVVGTFFGMFFYFHNQSLTGLPFLDAFILSGGMRMAFEVICQMTNKTDKEQHYESDVV